MFPKPKFWNAGIRIICLTQHECHLIRFLSTNPWDSLSKTSTKTLDSLESIPASNRVACPLGDECTSTQIYSNPNQFITPNLIKVPIQKLDRKRTREWGKRRFRVLFRFKLRSYLCSSKGQQCAYGCVHVRIYLFSGKPRALIVISDKIHRIYLCNFDAECSGRSKILR